jgi:long-chain acyl-CoA synthetase
MTIPTGWPQHTLAETYSILTAPGGPFEMEERNVRGIPLRTYVHAPATLREVFDRGAAWGDREYLVFQDERLTFAGVHRAASLLGHTLAAQFNVRKGDRVALAMRNLPEWVVTFWAVVAAGAVIVPINAWGTSTEIEHAIRDSGAKVLVVDRERLDRLGAGISELKLEAVIAARTSSDALGSAIGLETLIGPTTGYTALDEMQLPDPGLDTDDDATIFYTSGTTGSPKGALGTHRNMVTNLVNTGLRFARASLRRGEALTAPDPAIQRITLLPVPLFHVTGTHSGFVPAMLAGTKIVLMYRWIVDEALALIQQERVNTLVAVPAMCWQLVDSTNHDRFDLASLDTITYGGAPASVELYRRIVEYFPGVFVAIGFGMTETSSVVTSNSAEDLERRPDSVGTAMPCNDFRLVDEAGQDVPEGTPGELLVRGPNVIKGYWNRPEETLAALGDGWLHTGDIVRIDEEGFFYALDRAKDMIIRGGENIYCTEIEEVLVRHPEVVEVAVIGVPHPILGDEVGAVIRLTENALADDDTLRAFVAAHLAPFKVPVHIFRLSSALPRNISGKVLKRKLKADLLV